MVHLSGCLQFLVNPESFDNIFNGKYKKLSIKLIILPITHGIFLKIVFKLIFLKYSLIFSLLNIKENIFKLGALKKMFILIDTFRIFVNVSLHEKY